MNFGVNALLIAVFVAIASVVIIDIAIESETNAEAIQQLEANGYTVGGQWVAVPAGLTCNSLPVTLYGIAAAGDDPTVFFGTTGIAAAGDDPTVFYGTTGNDVIYIDTDGEGLPDKSWVFGDQGNDTICINATDDSMVWAGAGDDWVQGNNGEDWLKGQNGTDTIFGGSAADVIWGGQGDDVLDGEGAGDVIWGDEGDDTLTGGSGDDYVYGGDGDDSADCQAHNTGDFYDGGAHDVADTSVNCETTQNVP